MLALSLVVVAACSHNRPLNEPKPPTTSFSDQGASAAVRIGSFVESSVLAKSRDCWSQLQGEGVVAADLTFKKSSAEWILEKIAVTKLTLPDAQEAAVSGCLQGVAGTSFPVNTSEELENAAAQFVARVGWAVPLPPPGTSTPPEILARMIGGGGPLNDISGCSECVSNPNYPYGLKCEDRKSGGHLDCKEHSSNVCSTAPTACLRGAFGGTGAVVMF
jgi:hypothetical protein